MSSRKENRQFQISVEGKNCETLYFEHLAKIVNLSGENGFNLVLHPRVRTPYSYAKQNAYKPSEKIKGKSLPYIHIQDVEDYNSPDYVKKFNGIIDEMYEAKKQYRVHYELGYSNYTFELWLLLHRTDMQYQLADRYAYLQKINQWFNKDYDSLKEYKKEKEFSSILQEYITLESVKMAIRRAERLENNNIASGKQKVEYRGVSFFKDNPDTSVHKIVRLMLETCGVTI